jgi:hypothetical protein
VKTQRRRVARGETAPPAEDRRQSLPDLAGAEPQQPVTAAARERRAEAHGHGLVHAWRIVFGRTNQMPVRCHAQAQTGRGNPSFLPSAGRERTASSHSRPGPAVAEDLDLNAILLDNAAVFQIFRLAVLKPSGGSNGHGVDGTLQPSGSRQG